MCSCEKKSSLLREEKWRKNHHHHHHHQSQQPKNPKIPSFPSFSSTLLDEIYRSIDGNDSQDDRHHDKQRERDLNLAHRERSTISAKKYEKAAATKAAGGGGVSAAVEDEGMAILKRASLVEKWMEKEVNHHKVSSRKVHDYNHPPPPLPASTLFLNQDDDLLFFSSTSGSSESSNSGGLSSSSDPEFYTASAKTSKSCFSAIKKPKPIKTSVSKQKNEPSNQKTEEKDLIMSQSRALKIYANLKKVKDPISPGGRLSAFINNLFTNSKKNGNNVNAPSIPDNKPTKYISSNKPVSPPPSSACSSASSFSRSCLSKKSPNSRAAKRYSDGITRAVRFNPVSVIVDEDSRPCGQIQIHDLHDYHSNKPIVRPPTALSSQTSAASETKPNKILNSMGCRKQDFDFDDDDDDDDDGASDCSSDLFEIDHLALFGKGRYQEELPVYETTHLDSLVTNKKSLLVL